MAAAFDFEKYYTIEKVRTETTIDRSGVDLQNPTENTEIVTDNVVYYFAEVTYIYPNGVVGLIDGTDTGKRILVLRNGITSAEAYYVRPWHRADDLLNTGIDVTWDKRDGTRISTFTASPNSEFSYYIIDDAEDTGRVQIETFAAYVFPRHEAESGELVAVSDQIKLGVPVEEINQSVITDPTLMKLLYGALGFYGGRWKGNKWLNKWLKKSPSKLGRAVMAYDTFRKRIGELAEICAESDIGVNVTYYDKSFAEEVPEDATDDEIERADITKTDMTRKTTFQEAYGKHLSDFLDNHADLISEVRGTTSTALIPPVKEVVRAYFYPIDEIESEFEDLFVDTMKSLQRVPVLWKFVSESKKSRLKEVAGRYQTGEYDPAVADRMAFDLEILLNTLNKYDGVTPTDEILIPGKLYPMSYDYNGYPRLVQIGNSGDTTASHLVGQPYDDPAKVLYMWTNTYDAYVGRSVFRGYDDDGNNHRTKKCNRLSADEIDSILLAYFNNAYAKRVLGFELSYEYTIKPIKEGLLVDYEHTTYFDVKINGAFYQFYTEVSAFMNMMRVWGNDSGTEEDANGINAGAILGNLFVEGKPYYNYAKRFVGGEYYATVTKPYLFGYYDILSWSDSSIPDDITDDNERFTAEYTTDWKDLSSSPDVSIGYAVETVGVMKDIYKEMRTALTVSSLILGPVMGALASTLLNDVEDDVDRLDELANQLLWYQRYVKEAPFSNMSMIPDDNENVDTKLTTWTMPARMMFPVSMYQKVRVKYKNFFGRTRHKTVKRSIGVRWAEVTFYDTAVYAEYPQVTAEPGEDIALEGIITIENGTVSLPNPLPESALGRGDAVLVLTDGYGLEYIFNVTITSDVLLTVNDEVAVPGPYNLIKLRLPLAPAQPEIGKEPVEVLYEMPSLPYDSELRKKAFQDYGPFSHAVYFAENRYSTEPEPDDVQAALAKYDNEHKDGWVVFHNTSEDIKDLREGLGIHDKVAMLISILSREFGSNRVKLVETYRSLDDQIPLCSGGPESYFLSWHNYGLAARILILQADGKTPITKDGPEAKRMIPIAKAFTECCANGGIGTPCNVVWCARLAVGPSVFDWEFLPIGVGHKDAPKFREATISQMDPVVELGYVDVDRARMVYQVKPSDDRPYVLADSPRYKNAIVINGDHYMSPDSIRNYNHIDDIVLYDVKEYINLIGLKMNAHGTAKPVSGSLYDWKATNPESATQLIRYYAMTGNIPSAKAILAGDFVEKYGPIDDQFYSKDPVEYLRGMLGSHYYEARIVVPRDGESAYITLHDGIYHVKSMEPYPDNPPTRLDTHKQQQVDSAHMKWGSWHEGAFYTEDEMDIPVIDSERPVIPGYVSTVDSEGNSGWTPSSDEAIFIHQIVADHVHRKFDEIRKSFENFGGALMYDRIEDSPNSGMVDMLENEFGLIGAQDLIDFDDLERIIGTPEILEEKVDGSIYEKVVNNAQLSGIRKASLTKEHIHIKDTPSKSDAKTLYDLIQKGKGYMANDLLK